MPKQTPVNLTNAGMPRSTSFDISQIDVEGLGETEADDLISKHADAWKTSQQDMLAGLNVPEENEESVRKISFGGLEQLDGKSLHASMNPPFSAI